jgi:hypothetical protein
VESEWTQRAWRGCAAQRESAISHDADRSFGAGTTMTRRSCSWKSPQQPCKHASEIVKTHGSKTPKNFARKTLSLQCIEAGLLFDILRLITTLRVNCVTAKADAHDPS